MAIATKHYEAVAKTMRSRFELFRCFSDSKRNVPVDVCKVQFAHIVRELADLYAQDNRNFDRKKFYRDCAKLTEFEQIMKDFDSVEF